LDVTNLIGERNDGPQEGWDSQRYPTKARKAPEVREQRDGDGERGRERTKRVMDKIPDDVIRKTFPRQLKRNLVSTQVYNHLKRMILTGKLKKGERLIQETLAFRFDMSRSSVISSLSRSKEEGLINSRKGAGSFVNLPVA
jgi:DNA-binding transcriptional regulator YhcF (GntR family)